MRRTHDPARLCGRGNRSCRDPQHQRGNAGGLRGEGQFAAGDEVELARFAPDLEHNSAERVAGQRVGRGAQSTVDIGGAHRDQETRIEAELGEPAHRQRAVFAIGKILPHPDQRLARRHASGEPRDEAGRSARLMAGREHLDRKSVV